MQGVRRPRYGLLELEGRGVARAVDELHRQHAAGTRPRLVRLPDVRVLAAAEAEAALPGNDRRLDVVLRLSGRAAEFARDRIPRCEDREPAVTAEAELHRDCAAGLSDVENRAVVYRLEEPAP